MALPVRSTSPATLITLALLLFGWQTPARAAGSFEKDRAAILSMAGSFEVIFDFRETVGFAPDYKPHEPHRSTATEWVTVVEDTGTKIVLQHVLAVGDKAVKHWRQEWAYENGLLFEFKGRDRWEPRRLAKQEVAGTWTQRVFQTDDSPRYESYGAWVHGANLVYWESKETWRPLPRRELTSRDDYDVLVGRNRHTITPRGWVHEQDNYKLKLAKSVGGQGTVIAREVGVNSYLRTDDAATAVARDYWEQHGPFWANVRTVWAEQFAHAAVLQLRQKDEGGALGRQLTECSKRLQPAGGDEAKQQIREIISRFVVRE